MQQRGYRRCHCGRDGNCFRYDRKTDKGWKHEDDDSISDRICALDILFQENLVQDAVLHTTNIGEVKIATHKLLIISEISHSHWLAYSASCRSISKTLIDLAPFRNWQLTSGDIVSFDYGHERAALYNEHQRGPFFE